MLARATTAWGAGAGRCSRTPRRCARARSQAHSEREDLAADAERQQRLEAGEHDEQHGDDVGRRGRAEAEPQHAGGDRHRRAHALSEALGRAGHVAGRAEARARDLHREGPERAEGRPGQGAGEEAVGEHREEPAGVEHEDRDRDQHHDEGHEPRSLLVDRVGEGEQRPHCSISVVRLDTEAPGSSALDVGSRSQLGGALAGRAGATATEQDYADRMRTRVLHRRTRLQGRRAGPDRDPRRDRHARVPAPHARGCRVRRGGGDPPAAARPSARARTSSSARSSSGWSSPSRCGSGRVALPRTWPPAKRTDYEPSRRRPLAMARARKLKSHTNGAQGVRRLRGMATRKIVVRTIIVSASWSSAGRASRSRPWRCA